MISNRVRARRDTVAQLALQGKTPAEIAEATRETLDVIHGDLGYLKYYGIVAPRGRAKTAKAEDTKKVARIAKLASQGKSRKEIAETTGLPYQQVCHLIRSNGIEVPRPAPKRQAEHAIAIDQNRDIRLMVEVGFSARQIGVALGPGRSNATLRLRGLRLTANDPATVFTALDTQPRNLTEEAALALRAARYLLAGRSTNKAAQDLGVPLGAVRAAVKAFRVREELAAAAGRSGDSRAS